MTGTWLAAAAFVVPASPAAAQTPASNVPERRWSFDFGMGWDLNLSGNINSGGIGVLQEQAVVILPNRYEDVYGVGLHLRFGGGYKLDNLSEIRAVVTYQSLASDLTFLGDIGIANLYAAYDNYRSLTLDVGYRRYVPNTIEGPGAGRSGGPSPLLLYGGARAYDSGPAGFRGAVSRCGAAGNGEVRTSA